MLLYMFYWSPFSFILMIYAQPFKATLYIPKTWKWDSAIFMLKKMQSLAAMALPCNMKVLTALHLKQRKQHRLSDALKGRISLFTVHVRRERNKL